MFCDIFLVPFPCWSCDLSFFPSPDECRFPLQHPRGHQTLLRWPGLQEHLGFCTRKGLVLGGWRHWGATLCLIETTALLFPIFSEFIPIPRMPFLICLEYPDVSCFALLVLLSFALCCSPSRNLQWVFLQIAFSAPNHGVNRTRIFIFPSLDGKQVPKAWKPFDNYPNLHRWNKITC